MTALHNTCQALYSGECRGALVAGTNLILAPQVTVPSQECVRALSPDGICKTFDAEADGYARGEAVNAIFIKKLEDAIQDGDPIRAVIRATAINSDGKPEREGVPRADGQEQLIRSAYAKTQIQDVNETAFIECHGTGTQKGDLAGAKAITRIFDKGVHVGSARGPSGFLHDADLYNRSNRTLVIPRALRVLPALSRLS